MPVKELEAWIVPRKFFPEPPHTEVVAPLVRVVKQDDCALREFRQPALEIVRDGFVCVQSVDMQEIRRTYPEVCRAPRRTSIGARWRRSRTARRGNGGIPRRCPSHTHLSAYPRPGVDGMAPRGQAPLENGLAERRIRNAGMRPQLHEHTRSCLEHEPLAEGDVAPPGAEGSCSFRAPEQRRYRRVEQRAQAFGSRCVRRRVPLGAPGRFPHHVAFHRDYLASHFEAGMRETLLWATILSVGIERRLCSSLSPPVNRLSMEMLR